MTPEATRAVIALSVIAGFLALVTIVLIGFVDISNPEIAKLVGLIVGYFTAMLNPIIMRYFNERPT